MGNTIITLISFSCAGTPAILSREINDTNTKTAVTLGCKRFEKDV